MQAIHHIFLLAIIFLTNLQSSHATALLTNKKPSSRQMTRWNVNAVHRLSRREESGDEGEDPPQTTAVKRPPCKKRSASGRQAEYPPANPQGTTTTTTTTAASSPTNTGISYGDQQDYLLQNSEVDDSTDQFDPMDGSPSELDEDPLGGQGAYGNGVNLEEKYEYEKTQVPLVVPEDDRDGLELAEELPPPPKYQADTGKPAGGSNGKPCDEKPQGGGYGDRRGTSGDEPEQRRVSSRTTTQTSTSTATSSSTVTATMSSTVSTSSTTTQSTASPSSDDEGGEGDDGEGGEGSGDDEGGDDHEDIAAT